MAFIQKILVPTDFSEGSQEALQYACKLAKEQDSSVTILHIFEVKPYLNPIGNSVVDDRVYNSLRNSALESLSAAKEEAKKQGVEQVETLLRGGVAFDAITQEAKQGAYGLIVVGTHGRTGLRHILIGSVAERVVRYAPCPVLVVPTTKLAVK